MTLRFGKARCSAYRKEIVNRSISSFTLTALYAAVRAAAVGGPVIAVGFVGSVGAQTPTTSDGPPPPVIPQVGELGMPNFTIPTGTANPFIGNDGGDDRGSGTATGGGSDAASGGDGDNLGSSNVLNTMISQPWGIAAVNNAQALGVNPSALAATCVLESGCKNVGSGGSSSATGAFQMMSATYNSMISAALAQNPGLASSIVPGAAGMIDPATESIAASEYLLQGAQTLQSAGISDPTVLQVRGYYNFGPGYAAQLASAPDDEPIANVLSGMSQSALTANGIAAGETVGQWRSAVSAKLGTAANQSVLAS